MCWRRAADPFRCGDGVIPWERLDTAALADGSELRLFRRGEEYSIRLGGGDTAGTELMNSRLFGSEEELARLALAAAGGAGPRILIGGLGMGFTLRAALALVGPAAQVTVAELVPAVIAWARGPLAPVFAGSLDDPRVVIREGDAAALIHAGRGAFDAILLDTDNGPDALTVPTNDALYSPEGLAATRAALAPGGALAIWSSRPDARFTARLAKSGFAVEEHRVRAGRGSGARHVVWVARRNDTARRPAPRHR